TNDPRLGSGTNSALDNCGGTAKGRAAQRLKVGRGSPSGGESCTGGGTTPPPVLFFTPSAAMPRARNAPSSHASQTRTSHLDAGLTMSPEMSASARQSFEVNLTSRRRAHVQ